MPKRAVYPGTFDPVTLGHIDVIQSALKFFDEVYVAVARNTSKEPVFSTEERIGLLQRATRSLRRVRVEAFDGLVVDYARKKKAKVVIRSVRATSDFDYEFQMALMNRKLAPEVQTIFLMPSEKHFYLSSTLIKEVARLGGRVKDFVPPFVEEHLTRALGVR